MAFKLVAGRNGSWVLDSCMRPMYRHTRLSCIATWPNVPSIWSTESGISLGEPNHSHLQLSVHSGLPNLPFQVDFCHVPLASEKSGTCGTSSNHLLTIDDTSCLSLSVIAYERKHRQSNINWWMLKMPQYDRNPRPPFQAAPNRAFFWAGQLT
ncbi:hypothetical protein LZ30DRAFT_215211 [Colletotrichum cereale]|nr:hypothetical protein LZ30DRAFT_215211 [Colletotrichum cereale]